MSDQETGTDEDLQQHVESFQKNDDSAIKTIILFTGVCGFVAGIAVTNAWDRIGYYIRQAVEFVWQVPPG